MKIILDDLTFEAKSAINYSLDMEIENKDIRLPIAAEEAGIGNFLDGLTADLEKRADQTGPKAGDETLRTSMLTQRIEIIIPRENPGREPEI